MDEWCIRGVVTLLERILPCNVADQALGTKRCVIMGVDDDDDDAGAGRSISMSARRAISRYLLN